MLTKMHENDRELLGWAQYVFLLFILLFFLNLTHFIIWVVFMYCISFSHPATCCQ